MVKKVEPDGTYTIYIDGIYEVHKDNIRQVVSTTTYYPVAGAMRVDGNVYYVLGDQLGSTSVVTNSSSSEVGTLI
jgi:hypothetical protein